MEGILTIEDDSEVKLENLNFQLDQNLLNIKTDWESDLFV